MSCVGVGDVVSTLASKQSGSMFKDKQPDQRVQCISECEYLYVFMFFFLYLFFF